MCPYFRTHRATPEGEQNRHPMRHLVPQANEGLSADNDANQVDAIDNLKDDVTMGSSSSGAYETIDQVDEPPPTYDTIRTSDHIRLDIDPYATMLRPIQISQVHLGRPMQSSDSMICLLKGTYTGDKGRKVLVMLPKKDSTHRDFAAKYLEAQIDVVEKMRNTSGIEVPFGFIITQGLRQPVFEQPALLLSDHLRRETTLYENVIPKSKPNNKSIPTVYTGLQTILSGIAVGLSQLHEAGALVYGLDTSSVFVHTENERLIAKLSSFSESSFVRQRDRLAFKEGERDVRRLAPETIDSLKHTSKSDVWVMAILFWEIISGKQPYYNYYDINEAEVAILEGHVPEKPSDCQPKM
ncbi:hypothetical protein CAPTEDRAFT_210630 [Capitella teleta]|uniref:Protein kinase domain-containing protein n=1 Tax=Capitella teleta TaxID=283909 RepID=R7V6F8_CAPTE|nr:hypothetical protein CAPTEDRAFT_210630 [Capitella teleta]|eukprot:ELU11345.1 hypothetical protein CAPTEDRAFT_210630 [Capitella teleta]